VTTETKTDLVCHNLPNGILTFVNESYCRFFGKSYEQLIGHNFQPVIPENDRSIIEDRLNSLDREHPVAVYEHRVILRNGQIRWIQWISRKIFGIKGKCTGFQSTGRDITNTKPNIYCN